MHIALWVIQVLLALLFLFTGGMKLFAFDRFRRSAEQRHPDRELGLSKGLVRFIGGSEVAGAFGLVLPESTSVLPALTPLAAIGLGIIMVLAIRFHLNRQEPVSAPLLLLLLCVLVAVGRSI